jgi:hypothetical protein
MQNPRLLLIGLNTGTKSNGSTSTPLPRQLIVSEAVPFQWHDTDTAHLQTGEGISRPKQGAKVRPFALMVFPQGAQPIKWYTKAESKTAAIRYAQARWPGAAVEVI